jgi:hypothetical protein
MYTYNNPYVAKSSHPADDVNAWDFEAEFCDYLEMKGYPLHLLGHRDAPDTDKYETEFLEEMSEDWEDVRAERLMEEREMDRDDDDRAYWDSL